MRREDVTAIWADFSPNRGTEAERLVLLERLANAQGAHQGGTVNYLVVREGERVYIQEVPA